MRSKHGIKGPVFPSMRDQSTAPKRVMVWIPGTQSLRQRKKTMRHKVQSIINSKDPQIIAAGDRCIRSVCDEPDPEYSALHLFCAALDASNDTGETWATCMNYIMSKFDERAAPVPEVQPDATPKKASQGRLLLSGLLRGLIPRALRKSDATAAEVNVDQPRRSSIAERIR